MGSPYLERPCLQISGLENIPTGGSLIVVANHRLGALDGIIMEALLRDIRADRKMLSLSKYRPLLSERIIEIGLQALADATPSAEVLRSRRSTRLEIVEHIQVGGCLVVFQECSVTVFDRESSVNLTSLTRRLRI
ncbi:MAG: hypothetical protein GY798_08815 [Hyphomicrobiales bacterium]|nr:hypothetical protein [Hyphomicrobiales bacterium]